MRVADGIKSVLRVIGRGLQSEGGRRVVLCYHSIHPSTPFRSATPELFADHLGWLREHCRCIPFGEVLLARDQVDDGRPIVSVTFDDGYADNHEYALPLLARAGVHATFFLTVGLLEADRSTVARLQRLWRIAPNLIRPLVWNQVADILDAGMEVGAHTFSHPNLARLDNRRLEWELGQSKLLLENRLGREITMMAYPFGRPRVHFTATVLDAVERAGYDLAAAVGTRGVKLDDHPLSVPRMFVTNDSVEVLSDKVFGVWDLIGTVRDKMPLSVSRVISPADFRV